MSDDDYADMMATNVQPPPKAEVATSGPAPVPTETTTADETVVRFVRRKARPEGK